MTAQIIDLYSAKMQRWASKLYEARQQEENRRATLQAHLQEYAAAIADVVPSRTLPRAPRVRGMHLTESAAAVLARLNRGDTITSMGQIDKPTQRMLDKLTKKGWLVEGRDCSFPKIKRCWAARRLLEEEEEGLVQIDGNLKF